MGCSAKQAPKYSGPLFALDNRDAHNILLRYKKDVLVVAASDPKARAAICFLKDDFKNFIEQWIEADVSTGK